MGKHDIKCFLIKKIEPRLPLKSIPVDVYILFRFDGLIKGKFEPNHFVPLICTGKRNISNERSISQSAPRSLPKRQMTISTSTSTSYTQDPNEKIQSKLYFYMHKSSKPGMSDINTSHSDLNVSNTLMTSNSTTNSKSSSLYTLFNTIPDTKLITSTSSTKVETLDTPDSLASSIPDTTDSAVKNVLSSFSSQLQEPTSSSIPTQECESISQENINYDVAFYRQKAKGMKTSQIQDLIKNIFKPGKSFLFPKTSKRSFRFEWLEQFPWLQYSQSLDGAFCLPCVLFCDQFPTKNGKITKLFTEPRKY